GLRDGQQIAQLAVDPKNADRLFVAVAGHPYGPNEERGVFRSVDGAKPSKRCFTAMKTLAPATCRSIRAILRLFIPRCGIRAKVRGKMASSMETKAAFSNRPMAVRHGGS